MKISAAAILISLTSVSAFNSYLGNLSKSSAPAKVAPPTTYKQPQTTGLSYLDNLKPASSRQGGSGLTGYLDALKGGAKPASPTPKAAAPAPVAAAPKPAAPAPKAAAPAASYAAPAAAGDYLSSLKKNASVSGGAGLQGYLSTLPQNSAVGGAGFQGYLSVLKVNAAGSSGAGLKGYTDALACNSSGKTALVGGGAAASSSMAAFLESVYKQIQSLPASAKTQVGSSISFSATANGMAMAFVKN